MKVVTTVKNGWLAQSNNAQLNWPSFEASRRSARSSPVQPVRPGMCCRPRVARRRSCRSGAKHPAPRPAPHRRHRSAEVVSQLPIRAAEESRVHSAASERPPDRPAPPDRAPRRSRPPSHTGERPARPRRPASAAHEAIWRHEQPPPDSLRRRRSQQRLEQRRSVDDDHRRSRSARTASRRSTEGVTGGRRSSRARSSSIVG